MKLGAAVHGRLERLDHFVGAAVQVEHAPHAQAKKRLQLRGGERPRAADKRGELQERVAAVQLTTEVEGAVHIGPEVDKRSGRPANCSSSCSIAPADRGM